jgi:hypothetical protein
MTSQGPWISVGRDQGEGEDAGSGCYGEAVSIFVDYTISRAHLVIVAAFSI